MSGTSPAKAVIRPLAIGVALVALFAYFFVYPAHDPRPRELPVVVVGDDGGVSKLLEQRGFDVTTADSLDQARDRILDRDAYAAIEFEQGERNLLVSSAASVPVADAITRVATEAPDDRALTIVDVRPVSKNDPRGLSINLAVLATTVPAILGAMLIVTLAPMVTGTRRLAAIVALAIVGGLASTLVIHVGIGAIPGSFPALWGITALAVFSIGVTAAALIQLLGAAGVGVSFLVLLMLGNPASGAAGGPYLLPEPWRTGGQFMPPGAFASGLRNVAYFDGAQAATWATVLVVWAVLGTAVVLRPRRTAHGPAAAPA